ncbi:MAG: hypothetical protein ABGX76_16685 [Cobetia sp.]
MKKPRQLAMIAAWRGFLVSIVGFLLSDLTACGIWLLAGFAARSDQPRRF